MTLPAMTQDETATQPKKCFEDFPEDFVFTSRIPGLTAGEIKEFASRYDPQRFHVDEEEAAQTHFGGLIASGFQTQMLCFGPFCREVLLQSWAVGAPGIDKLQWLRPWWPGEELKVKVTLLNKRQSGKRNDRGYLHFILEAAAGEEPVISMEWTVIMLTRAGARK